MKLSTTAGCRHLILGLGAIVGLAAAAEAGTLRIVTYNIQADTGGQNGQLGGPTAGPGLTTVLQAIGSEHLAGNTQPIDLLALEELNAAPATTLSFIVGQLNGIYGSGTYAYDTTIDPTDGGGTGNGPNGLIFNTKTVTDLGATAIGLASSSGAPRAPMRYSLQPLGGSSANQFFLYVSHAKSGTTSSDAMRRNIETTEIRADASTLAASAHIIYTGDFNINGSSEQSYQTLVSSSLNGGVGTAFDPANPAEDWADTSAFAPLLSESATSLRFRDDMQLVTGPTLNGPGFQLVAGTEEVFGNNGTTALSTSVNQASNTALSDLPNRTAVLSALTTATDHLPMIADYQFASSSVPEPDSRTLVGISIATLWLVTRKRRRGFRDQDCRSAVTTFKRSARRRRLAGSPASGDRLPEACW
jgi:hypothetical protein